jgi:tetraacyldisaccharide 4'-kinase
MIERIWFGDSAADRAARTALIPAERVFAAISGLRTLLYDAGWLKSEWAKIPTISVGNLTVGGTGKTPIAAWVAGWLRDHDARPAVVLRGYGDDEPEVHRVLNPDIEVVVDADRRRGVALAASHGADVVVLDDAFQHRRLARTADIVVVSADQWTGDVRLLPAGPWREPLSAARRASLVIVTRKAASEQKVDAVHEALSAVAPRLPRVSVHLSAAELRQVGGEERERLETLRSQRIPVITAIGDPTAFIRQLEGAGATVDPTIFPDHHPFTTSDIAPVIASVPSTTRVLCTLKDAVKLSKIWPHEAPGLWYVSQRVIVERGVGGVERLLTAALESRDAPQTMTP